MRLYINVCMNSVKILYQYIREILLFLSNKVRLGLSESLFLSAYLRNSTEYY